MHAIAVVFDFVEPLLAFRRGVDELGQLRPDPLRQSGHGAPYCKTTGSIKLESSFLTLPTRGLTGQEIMSSDGWKAGLPIAGPGTSPCFRMAGRLAGCA